jgi:hypothetical protein
MAAYNTTNYNKMIAPGASSQLSGYNFQGKVRACYDEFTFAGEASGSTVNLAIIQRAYEVCIGINFQAAALGSSVTIALGDSGSAARFMAAVTCTSAAQSTVLAATGLGYTPTADNPIIITTGGAAATGKIQIAMLFIAHN